ncbi:hypothetical protein [Rhodococcus opacus]|uniref:hypothetical protein n=1 Tax=Rhodococcus opacus TaxID=37919 RepID=UPI0012FE7675|nr:hypothetical protein [Rhodococcus opacus]
MSLTQVLYSGEIVFQIQRGVCRGALAAHRAPHRCSLAYGERAWDRYSHRHQGDTCIDTQPYYPSSTGHRFSEPHQQSPSPFGHKSVICDTERFAGTLLKKDSFYNYYTAV